MNSSEKSPLLTNSDDRILTKPKGVRALIEVVIVLYYACDTMSALTVQQYIFSTLSQEYQYANSDVKNSSEGSPQCKLTQDMGGNIFVRKQGIGTIVTSEQNIQTETPVDKNCSIHWPTNKLTPANEQRVQADSASVMLILSITRSCASLLATFSLGPFSDAHGRKSAILFPLFGTASLSIISAITSGLGLNYWYLIIGYITDGFSGSYVATLMLGSAYIADIASTAELSFRMSLLETCQGIAIVIGSSTSGLLIDYLGYFHAFVFFVGVAFVNILFVVCIIQESNKQRDPKAKVQCKYLVGWIQIYLRDTKDGRRWKLLLNLVLLFINTTVGMSVNDLKVYFLKGVPFHFTAVQIGIFVGVATLAQNIGGAAGVKILSYIISDYWLTVIGFASLTTFLLLTGLAASLWMLILAHVIGVFSQLVYPMVRSVSSKLVEPDKQGTLFSGIACAVTLMDITGVSTFNSIYSATVHITPGFVFLVMAGTQSVGLVLACCQVFLMRRKAKITYWATKVAPEA